jgi:hypothetical protein
VPNACAWRALTSVFVNSPRHVISRMDDLSPV